MTWDSIVNEPIEYAELPPSRWYQWQSQKRRRNPRRNRGGQVLQSLPEAMKPFNNPTTDEDIIRQTETFARGLPTLLQLTQPSLLNIDAPPEVLLDAFFHDLQRARPKELRPTAVALYTALANNPARYLLLACRGK